MDRALGIDFGQARIGVAISDELGMLAHPLETVPAGPGAVGRIAAIVREKAIACVIVGVPKTMGGKMGAAADQANAFVEKLRGSNRRGLVVSARYDPTFLPRLTLDLFREHERHGVGLEKVIIPCGHYTLAKFPFNWIDGYVMIRFLKRELAFSHELH